VIAKEATIAVVEKELEGARAWAARNAYDFEWDPDALMLRVVLRHRSSGELFFLSGGLESYPVLPPVWTFVANDWSGAGELVYCPKPDPNIQAPGGAWLFIAHGGRAVICAPFNRLSYGDQGPHAGWGDAAHWKSVEPGRVHAHEIGSMLAVIDRDLQYTKGRMP
jgi:hypothetical protein